MKTDRYTKVILTVIAFCLTFNVLKDLEIIPKAHANNVGVPNKNFGLVPVNPDGSVDVNIKSSSTIDVDITDISTSDEMDVNIDEVGGYSTYGTLPVKVK